MRDLIPNGNKVRLTVSLDNIRKFDKKLYKVLCDNPSKYSLIFKEQLNSILKG
jgi:hypothetical protein